jgi:RNA polymerase sigma-70 factor (ECF subfamily)
MRRDTASATAPAADRALVPLVLRGDESAFAALLDRHGGSLLRLARALAPDRGEAERLARETWLCALDALSAAGARSSLRALLFRILCERAGAGTSEGSGGQLVPEPDGDPAAPAVEAGRFDGSGAWADPPRRWAGRAPGGDGLPREATAELAAAVEALPRGERAVLILRDLEGLADAEVCELLCLGEPRERTLLRRARGRVYRAMEARLAGPRAS